MTRITDFIRFAFFSQKITESEYCTFEDERYFLPSTIDKVEKIIEESTLENINKNLFNRYSSRQLKNKTPTINDAKKILNASYGFLTKSNRTIPSAGGYYPLKLFLCKIENGNIINIYEYCPQKSDILFLYSLNQPLKETMDVHHVDFKSVSWMILWSCRLTAIASRYGSKSYRFVCIEVGHSAQMAILECLSLGFESITIGGLNELFIRESILKSGRRNLPQYAMLF